MLAITLPEKTETWVKEQASRRGIEASQFAAEIIENAASRTDGNETTIALMNQWIEENKTDDPDELARREKEGEEFMHNLARNRFDMEGKNARNLWP